VGVLFNLTVVNPMPAYSAGITTENFSANQSAGHFVTAGYGNASWVTDVTALTANQWITAGGYYAMIFQANNPGTSWGVYEYIQAYDLTGLPEDAEISSVKIYKYQNRLDETGSPLDWQLCTWAIFQTVNSNGTLESTDYPLAYQQRVALAPSKAYWTYEESPTQAWEVYEFYDSAVNNLINTLDSNKQLWVTFMPVRRLWTNGQLSVYPSGISKNVKVLTASTAPYKPYIKIEYIDNVIERETIDETNAPVEPMPTGYETADNITWRTPRCAFADETLRFAVSGESGANITLRALDSEGLMIAGVSDSIRTDGKYYWHFEVPDNYSGWLHVVEDNNGLYSEWGRVELPPSDSCRCLKTYAGTMDYPQYDNDFSDYVVYKNGLMFVYWNTNVENDEMDEYAIALYSRGDETTGDIYDVSLEWLNDNYYKPSANNTFLAGWRYAIFSPSITETGFDNRDGMVIDLHQEYNYNTSGFIVPVIKEIGSDEVIAGCHSAYWYLYDAEDDGLVFSVSNGINIGETFKAYVTVGEYSRVPTNLQYLELSVIDSVGQVYSSTSSVAFAGENKIDLTAPAQKGNYQLRYTFHDADVSPYFSYTYDLPFKVWDTGETGGGEDDEGGGGIIDRIDDWLENIGLDNAGGHWLALILGMLALFMLCYRSELMRVVFPLCLFASAIIFGWIDLWFVILLAFGAGVFIFSMLRKKATGGQEE
jgi:hypothetical protein